MKRAESLLTGTITDDDEGICSNCGHPLIRGTQFQWFHDSQDKMNKRRYSIKCNCGCRHPQI